MVAFWSGSLLCWSAWEACSSLLSCWASYQVTITLMHSCRQGLSRRMHWEEHKASAQLSIMEASLLNGTLYEQADML